MFCRKETSHGCWLKARKDVIDTFIINICTVEREDVLQEEDPMILGGLNHIAAQRRTPGNPVERH
jgi:hypothetical protein